MKTITLAAAFLVVAVAVHTRGLTSPGSPNAADPKGTALDTSFLKQYAATRGFMLGRPQKPKITPDGKAVLFLRADPAAPKMKLFEFDVATGKTRELLSPESLLKGAEENLTPEERARRERQRVSVGGFADFALSPDGQNVLVKLSNRLYLYSRQLDVARELNTGPDGAIVDPKWAPDSGRIAYVRGFDIHAFDIATWKESAVTTGGTAVKTHGLAEFVAQEEMHRFSGWWWSPDSKQIAYEEADHAGVETWYVSDPLKPDVKPQEQFYPRPGKKNVAVRLGLVSSAGGPTTWVQWDRAAFEYLAAVRWDELGPLTIQLQDRKQQRLALFSIDPKTGAAKLLLEEKDAAWSAIRPDSPRYNGALGGFVWPGTDRDGEDEIQLRDWNSGKPTDVLVPAKQNPSEVLSVHSSRFETFIVYSAEPDPTRKQVFRHKTPSRIINPGSEDEPLSPAEGISTASIGKFGGPYTITTTTLKAMPATTVFGRDTAKVGELPSVATESPFVPNVSIQKVGDYWTGICRPRDFDAKKKYPVVVYTYGGPTSKVVTQEMQPWLLRQWIADQGFIVVAIDNRGTSGRGREWEKGVYQKFGTVPLDDQVKGLAALCDKFPELDRERVGIVGGSFGGYMAANGVLRRPDVFKAAVAMAPVTDWEDYDSHYTERYLGLLPESKKAYDDGNLLPLAKDLKRPLLLIHGTADDNVYYRHTLKLSDALFRAGRDFEVLPLPGVTHMISRDPVVEKVWAKAATFFKRHLGEPR